MQRSAVQRLNRLHISGWISPGDGIESGCTTVIALRIAASTRRGSSAACKLPTTRLVNVICHRGSYEILTDAYVRGVDEACIILDMIARTTLSSRTSRRRHRNKRHHAPDKPPALGNPATHRQAAVVDPRTECCFPTEGAPHAQTALRISRPQRPAVGSSSPSCSTLRPISRL